MSPLDATRPAAGPMGLAPGPGDELLFVPLGGSGEIGMNLNLYGYGGQWLMVDCGVMFGDDSTPGIELIMPDPQFITERREDLLALVLTHGHEDHIGAVAHLWPRLRCPVYASPFTAALLRRKLAEAGLKDELRIRDLPLDRAIRIGPFEVEAILLTHSIPEPSALVLRTPLGTILHTGDWKFDPDPLVGPVADEAALRRLGESDVLALIGDSTNALVPGTSGSERSVRTRLTELIGGYDGCVAVACFASNVARLETVAHAARAHDRVPALVGRSLRRIDEAAREAGYLRELPPFFGEQEITTLPRRRRLLLCTGSQGEPRAALSRIATDAHPHIKLGAGDTVIFSSRVIPGNERPILALQDRLRRLGVEVVTALQEDVHVSGHPAREELARMYQWVRPRLAIPVHGEHAHLTAHAELARDCQVPQTLVPENGSVVRLAPGTPAIVDHVPAGRLALDGRRLVPMDSSAIKRRRRIARDGAVVATLVVDGRGRLVAEPQLSLMGLADDDADLVLESAAAIAVKEAVRDLSGEDRRDDQAISETARRALRRVVLAEHGKKPPIEIHVVRV